MIESGIEGSKFAPRGTDASIQGAPQKGPGSPGAVLWGAVRKHPCLECSPREGLTFPHYLLVFSPAHPVLSFSVISSHLEAPCSPPYTGVLLGLG